MTDREKLIELMQKCKCNEADRNPGYCAGFRQETGLCAETTEISCAQRQLADHLIANGVTFATDNNVGDKWIPVTERLPEGECLAVSMLTGPAYEEMLIGYIGKADNWDTGYACESEGVILPNVTHWMPLPEPPKGE